SAECPALASEHHYIGLLIQSDIGKDVRQFGVQFGVNGVEGLRPVQRHDQHFILTLTTQGVIAAVIHKRVSCARTLRVYCQLDCIHIWEEKSVELKEVRAPLQSLFTAFVWQQVSMVLIGCCWRAGGALSQQASAWCLTLSHACASIILLALMGEPCQSQHPHTQSEEGA